MRPIPPALGNTFGMEDAHDMIDPELEPFLAIWKEGWAALPAEASIQDRRIVFEALGDTIRLPKFDTVETSMRFVPREPRNVPLRIDRHRDGGIQPCLIYMHGGGWMMGSPRTHADITTTVADRCGLTVISVDYALAPEYPFPTAQEEVADVLRWVRANAETLGIDPSKIVIGGDSAGANLAAATCILFRGSDLAPVGQLLAYPAVDFADDWPSCIENADTPMLGGRELMDVYKNYLRKPEDWHNPLAAPLLAEDHAGLPPAFVAVAQHDPLRDSGAAYADKLREAGVAVTFDEGKDLVHGYLRIIDFSSAARGRLNMMCDWLIAVIRD